MAEQEASLMTVHWGGKSYAKINVWNVLECNYYGPIYELSIGTLGYCNNAQHILVKYFTSVMVPVGIHS